MQRGESSTARCASTGNRQVSLPLSSLSFLSHWRGIPLSSCIREGVTRLSLTARVERGPSQGARSASKKDCRVIPSPPLTPLLPRPYNSLSCGQPLGFLAVSSHSAGRRASRYAD